MESPNIARSTDPGRQLSLASPKNTESRIMVVVVDATRELQLVALKYALEICNPGDTLYLLGILHQVMNPSTSPPKKTTHTSMIQTILGYKQKADTTAGFNGTSYFILVEEQRKKKAEYERSMNDPELQRLFTAKQVTPQVLIAPGPDRKVVTAKQALELRAEWVVLDKHLKSDKSYLVENLNCNLLLMKPKGQAVLIKVEREKNEDCNSSAGEFQIPLDNKSIDFGPMKAIRHIAEKDVSKSFSQISLTSSAPRISTQTTEDGPSARTEISSASFDSTPGGYLELNIASAQIYSHGDISPAKDRTPTGSDGEAQLRKEVQDESAPLKKSPSRVHPSESSEDDTAKVHEVKVGSLETPSSSAFYKMAGRSSMSTGDLGSLVPKSSSVAQLYRQDSAQISRGGDELMNILNPAPVALPIAGTPTPRSVRTLLTSLNEEDRNAQALTSSNSPNVGANKFGNQNQDNRLLHDNAGQSRRKEPRPFAPLCSYCQTPGPKFAPDANARKFTYAELEEATNNFDQENYIAEGGFGFVYRGRLEGGQEIAVKQYKAASSQGDEEFYSEVEVLKHAQHRNLVILIGYCTENERRLLVYEFVCNKSLDVHLSAKNVNVLKWDHRWKIAVGAARGLRYLHEECRIGCIVHRDMRPNNILLTHDYLPMVGDFGLARSQPSGDEAEETRVIGTLGYLAPEYAESGSITEKADVYSFGVVLLELITGRKAIDASRKIGEACLTEWARPLIDNGKTQDLVDPRLTDYKVWQVKKMVQAARVCVSKKPTKRPKMSEVLRLLEMDEDGENTLSRRQSLNNLSDVARTQSQNRIQGLTSQGKLSRELSLDIISKKANSNANGASSIMTESSTPVANDSPRRGRTADRPFSPGFKSAKQAKSPGDKSNRKPKKRELSYLDML